MPVPRIRKGASKKAKRAHASKVISEVSDSKPVEHTRRKFGAAKARKQAIAIGLKAAGLSKKRKKKK